MGTSNTIHMKIQADQQGAVQSFLALTDAQRKAELGLMKIGLAGKKAGKDVKGVGEQAKSAFDPKKLLPFVTGLIGPIGVTAAIAKVTAAYRKMEAVREEALSGMMESAMAIKPLVQLAETPEDLRRMVGEVEKSRTEAGMPVAEAAKLQFSLESLDLQKYRKQFAQLYGVADPAAIAEGSRTLIEAMGEEEVGDPLQAINKIFAASQASKTTAEEFAPAATLAGKFFSQIKATDEELLSALSVMSKGLKDADIAATQLRSLATVIAIKDFGGKGLWAGVQAIKAEVGDMTKGEQKKYFGRKEAWAGYLALISKEPEIRKLEERLGVIGGEAPGEDYMSRMMAAAKGVPVQVAEEEVRIAREKTKVKREEAYGKPEAKEETAKERVRRRSAEIDETAIPHALREALMWVADVFQAGPEKIARWGGERGMEQRRLNTVKRNREAIAGILKGVWEAPGDLLTAGENAIRSAVGMDPWRSADGEQPQPTTQPAQPIIHNHISGDHYHLNERQNLTKPGPLAPSVGVD